MSLGSRITALLTSLTANQVAVMSPEERRLLSDQLQRVLSLTVIQSHTEEANRTLPYGSRSGVLSDLRGKNSE